jgi:serine/threonine-protein kinase RsbW
MCSETRARCEPDTEQPLSHLRVCLAGDRRAISPVVESMMEALREFPCAAAADFAIETALREALANAVVHGCRNDATQLVECTLSCNACGEVHIVVRDPGPGFDPASVPDPLSGENVRSNHGRGIYLISRLMDRVWFERGGTAIHMVLEPRPAGASVEPPPFPQPLIEGMVHTW